MDQEKLKGLLKDCKTEEEAMKVLADNKIELTDDELEELRGGTLAAWECAVSISVSGAASASVSVATAKLCGF